MEAAKAKWLNTTPWTFHKVFGTKFNSDLARTQGQQAASPVIRLFLMKTVQIVTPERLLYVGQMMK